MLPDGGTVDGHFPDAVATACTVDVTCDDRIACTIDHCASGTCTHEPCADCCPSGLSCEVGYGCRAGRMPCTTDAECGDAIPCTLDRCRDAMFCEHQPQDGLCSDGQICLSAIGCIPRPPE